jgi:hypothetical protein
MASQKQIDANRRNAQQSTGPRTIEGLAKTRLNAMRDGITGQITTLSEEDRPVFEKLKAELIADLAPKTVMELKLASSIAWDTWRLDHLRSVEMSMYALGATNPETTVDCDVPQLDTAMSGALTFTKESSRFSLMSLYEQRLNRSIHKNLATLRELQAERKRNYEHDLELEVAMARANDFNGLTYKAPSRPSENGFVFSTSEILATANRYTVLYAAKVTVASARSRIQFAGAWDNHDPNRPNSGMHVAAAA